ncbi:MAG: hypothetical protein Q9N62_07110 [Ghiorsea sp.]|nr:hypothetical protein [Ghiorsea sp.]
MHQLIKKELTGCSKYREISTEKEISYKAMKNSKNEVAPKEEKIDRRDVGVITLYDCFTRENNGKLNHLFLIHVCQSTFFLMAS